MRTTVLPLALCLASTLLLGQSVDVPLANWTVPTYRAASASGGLATMADVTPGIGFVGIQPCRVADTRGNGAPIQGGIFPNSGLRTWDLTGLCGLPAGTDAISANFTVVAAGGIPAGSFLLAWPTGQSPPPTAIMTYGPGQIISNAAIVPLGPGEQMNVNVSGSTHIVMDVNGYFTDQYNAGGSFHAVSTNAAPAILAENTSTASEAVAIQAVITTTTPGPTGVAAVKGFNQGTNATGVGVWGKHNGGGWGVLGESATGFGVVALTAGNAANAAVWARNSSTADNISGVYGSAFGGGGSIYGVFGETSNSCCGAAGILGVGRGGRVRPGSGFPWVPGVRGESATGFGVVGLVSPDGSNDQKAGVYGLAVGAVGLSVADGYLGYSQGPSNYGVVSEGPALVAGNLQVTGNFSSANKFFIEPHPHDASKEIRYVSLEGPHAEVYFRGTAQVSRGVTRIAIPEDFGYVADPQTYSTLVTPVGTMATVAVVSEGPEGVVLQASRDVRVHYVVYAERAAVKNPNPIAENVHFRPVGDLDVFGALPDSYRRKLIQNGTLNPDGSVNVETANRLGWSVPEKDGGPISRTPSD